MRTGAILAVIAVAVVMVWMLAAAARAEAAGFRHRRSALLAKMGSPRHSAADVVARPGRAATIEGKFTYTRASKDLEDEYVVAELRRGAKWRRIGRGLTDSDGRVRFEVPGRWLRRAGQVRVRMTAVGDGSRAEAVIWVMAPRSKVVVFDIDGTLTPGDGEIIKRAVWGSAVKVRPGAADVVAHWAVKKRIQPIYLTGRPYLFNVDTRAWLVRHGFPPGPLITADSLRQALPTSGGVGAFKEAWLRRLTTANRLSVAAAYGNADTDVCAFARAGIAPSATYIFGGKDRACDGFAAARTIADFVTHLPQLRQ